MAINTIDGIVAAISAGQTYKYCYNKQTTNATAFTAGRWYNLATLPGSPAADTFPGTTMIAVSCVGGNAAVMTNASGNWTVAVDGSNHVTVDTITSHNFSPGQILTMNASWSTNTFMQGITPTITSCPTTHTFLFTKTQATQIATTEAGTAANMTPTNMTGCMPTGGVVNAAGYTKYLTGIEVSTAIGTGVPSWLMLVDMLMYYPAIPLNTASAQTLLGATTLPRYTSGNGVMMFLELATAAGVAQNLTMSYYNSAGSPVVHTLPGTVALTAATIPAHLIHSGVAVNNFGPFLPLAAGDTGVTTATYASGFTLAGTGTGTANLVLCKPLAQIPLTTLGVASGRDLVFNMPSMPIVYDGACLSFLVFAGAATAQYTNFQATLDFVWG